VAVFKVLSDGALGQFCNALRGGSCSCGTSSYGGEGVVYTSDNPITAAYNDDAGKGFWEVDFGYSLLYSPYYHYSAICNVAEYDPGSSPTSIQTAFPFFVTNGGVQRLRIRVIQTSSGGSFSVVNRATVSCSLYFHPSTSPVTPGADSTMTCRTPSNCCTRWW